jgi:hypothetical protein
MCNTNPPPPKPTPKISLHVKNYPLDRSIVEKLVKNFNRDL